MMRSLLITVLLFTLGVALGQQDARIVPWTLDAAVTHAVKNSVQIRQAYLDVLDAEIYKSQAVGNFLPSLNVSLGHSWKRMIP